MFLINFTLIFLSFGVSEATNTDTKLYVDPNDEKSVDDDTCGSETIPCKTLFFALSQFPQPTVDDTSTIEIKTGSICIETHQLELDIPLTVQGADRAVAITGDNSEGAFADLLLVKNCITAKTITAQRNGTCSFATITTNGAAIFMDCTFLFCASGNRDANAFRPLLDIDAGSLTISTSSLAIVPTEQQLTLISVRGGEVAITDMDMSASEKIHTENSPFFSISAGHIKIDAQVFPAIDTGTTSMFVVQGTGHLELDSSTLVMAETQTQPAILVEGGVVELSGVVLEAEKADGSALLVDITGGQVHGNYLIAGSDLKPIKNPAKALFTHTNGDLTITNSFFSCIERGEGKGGIVSSVDGAGKVVLHNNVFEHCVTSEVGHSVFVSRTETSPFTAENVQMTFQQWVTEKALQKEIVVCGAGFDKLIKTTQFEGTIPEYEKLTDTLVLAVYAGEAEESVVPLSYLRNPWKEGDVWVSERGLDVTECGLAKLPCATIPYTHDKVPQRARFVIREDFTLTATTLRAHVERETGMRGGEDTKTKLTLKGNTQFEIVDKTHFHVEDLKLSLIRMSTEAALVVSGGKLEVDSVEFEVGKTAEQTVLRVAGGATILTSLTFSKEEDGKLFLLDISDGQLRCEYSIFGSDTVLFDKNEEAVFKHTGGDLTIESCVFSNIKREGKGGIVDSTGGIGSVQMDNNVFESIEATEAHILLASHPVQFPFTDSNLRLTNSLFMTAHAKDLSVVLIGPSFSVPITSGRFRGSFEKYEELTTWFFGVGSETDAEGDREPLVFYEYRYEEGDVHAKEDGLDITPCGREKTPCRSVVSSLEKIVGDGKVVLHDDLQLADTPIEAKTGTSGLKGWLDTTKPKLTLTGTSAIGVKEDATFGICDLILNVVDGTKDKLFSVAGGCLSFEGVELQPQTEKEQTLIEVTSGELVISTTKVEGEGAKIRLLQMTGGTGKISEVTMGTETHPVSNAKEALISFEGGTLLIEHSTFSVKRTEGKGAVLESIDGQGQLTMEKNKFIDCRSQTPGHSIFIQRTTTPFSAENTKITNSEFSTPLLAQSVALVGASFLIPVEKGSLDGTIPAYDDLSGWELNLVVGKEGEGELLPLVFYRYPFTTGKCAVAEWGVDIEPCGRDKLPCRTLAYALKKQGEEDVEIEIEEKLKLEETTSMSGKKIVFAGPPKGENRAELVLFAPLILKYKAKGNRNAEKGEASFSHLDLNMDEVTWQDLMLDVDSYTLTIHNSSIFAIVASIEVILQCNASSLIVTQSNIHLRGYDSTSQFILSNMATISFDTVFVSTPPRSWMQVYSMTETATFTNVILAHRDEPITPPKKRICEITSAYIEMPTGKVNLDSCEFQKLSFPAFSFSHTEVTGTNLNFVEPTLGLEGFDTVKRTLMCSGGSLKLTDLKEDHLPMDKNSLWINARDGCVVTLDDTPVAGPLFVPQPAKWEVKVQKKTKTEEAKWTLDGEGQNLFPCGMMVEVSVKNKSGSFLSVLDDPALTTTVPDSLHISISGPLSALPFPTDKQWSAVIRFSSTLQPGTDPIEVTMPKVSKGGAVAVAVVVPIVVVLFVVACIVVCCCVRKRKTGGYAKMASTDEFTSAVVEKGSGYGTSSVSM
ncbi:hypothetical protein BLNAU_10578 [Blattamonas nauphoetae]|uniref:Uncharacterized protein n=1 Tax=Blattamonas nauphoetae TaxID=2049346 RepID=A0ABQ9XRQ8_9EUKA|nr:hypothetical protein BLNAU_10578 [Blattamonas nauphoetae]